eukprot:7003466-Prymnesium_polylepis.1
MRLRRDLIDRPARLTQRSGDGVQPFRVHAKVGLSDARARAHRHGPVAARRKLNVVNVALLERLELDVQTASLVRSAAVRGSGSSGGSLRRLGGRTLRGSPLKPPPSTLACPGSYAFTAATSDANGALSSGGGCHGLISVSTP